MRLDPAKWLFGGLTFVNRQNFGDIWVLDLSLASPYWRQAGTASQPENSASPGIAGFPSEAIISGMLAFLLYASSRRRTWDLVIVFYEILEFHCWPSSRRAWFEPKMIITSAYAAYE
jgi:hypothetical protein